MAWFVALVSSSLSLVTFCAPRDPWSDQIKSNRNLRKKNELKPD